MLYLTIAAASMVAGLVFGFTNKLAEILLTRYLNRP
jgi:hypothetical protein